MTRDNILLVISLLLGLLIGFCIASIEPLDPIETMIFIQDNKEYYDY
jgi:hypothetical protein